MVYTRDKIGELCFLPETKKEERGFLTEKNESIEGSYQRQERTSYQGQDSRKMVPTRDNREQRGLLPETREN